ncbi:hypothetical protein QR680_001384 [Steinernema hermaphroditum]|uniref:G-patch domain-containing protein n=1 Tax=Steinernema hermaphroditum TaxID=289476 RepID=A0AA39LFC1_9BILA|nr:hypothetical protein QR680_001384 [Steinernema hermaphroditum]
MCAAAEGKLEAVKFIIANGANTKLCDSNGRSAESLAAMFRHYDVRECLTNLRMQTRSDNSLKRTGSAAVDLKNCSDCGSSYTDEAHFSSIVHIISTSKPIEAPGYSIPEWNIGYQMLQKTGWKETQGLGKCGEGKRYPVRTALKRDRKGLAVPHSPSSRKLVVKEREEQLAKERRIAIKIRQEFMQ